MAGRRGNGEGAIAQRTDGTWEARFSYVDQETGRARRSSSYGKTRKEARTKMDAARARIEAGQPIRDARIVLGDFVEQWIATTLRVSDRKDSTKALYATLARNYLQGEGIGAVTLDRLKASDVEGLIGTMRDLGKASSTIRQTYTILRAVLDAAVRDGYVSQNVAAAIKRPGVERTEARFLSPGELGQLFAAAEGSRFLPLFKLLAYTGMRRGEALALRWSDVDVPGGVLHIRGTLSRVGGRLLVTAPKTDRSRRVVPLSASVLEQLEARRLAQDVERKTAGSLWQESGLVFTTEIGRAVEPRNVLRALTVAAARAKLDGVHVHTLRHSAAGAMLSAGVPLKAVSDLLGHSSVAITGDVYGHLTPDVPRGAVDALAEALKAATTPITTPTRQ